MKTQVETQYKIALFGDGGVGKTTLVNRYVTGKFSENLKMTIGVEFYTKILSVEGKGVSLKIWDFAGDNQNQFRNLLPNYAQGASGGIFMFDITRFHSIKNIDEWLKILLRGYTIGEERIPLLLVGGKLDLEEKRSVDFEFAEEIAKLYNIYDYIECSSITGKNVERVFESISKKMLDTYL
ncbi:MAG: Rab family GTPase [Promethearchaeota archaeon]